MSKTITSLIEEYLIIDVLGDTYADIAGIAFDSREVHDDYVFVAIKGVTTDGHHHIEDAIKRGAVAIVTEEIPQKRHKGVTYVHVSSSRKALGQIAHYWFDCPSEDLKIVGATGTNGKTTVVTLLFQMLQMSGEKSGLITTAETIIGHDVRPRTDATPTTPDPVTLHKLLREMADAGCTHVCMEVSSHAMDQDRVEGIHFAGGIFTNITHDHLDYHGTFERYLAAKQSFFDILPETAFALANLDDDNGPFMLQNTKAATYYYGLHNESDFDLDIDSSDISGSHIQINDQAIVLPIPGTYNAYNATAAYGAAILLGIEEDRLPRIMKRLTPPPGRFEVLRRSDNRLGVLDYAHTPDALENLLQSIRDLGGNRRIITVFGAGGDRDTSKRPLMGQAATRHSDHVVITADNPRHEDPLSIANDILDGVPREKRDDVTVSPDREEAIKAALMISGKDDVVVLAGKGHENYQEVGGTKHPFSDKEIFLRARL